ncbi:MAG: FliM/FliN family flagellar motor switch protein [Burkholderiaceae bacterium]|nr:FliM/FliN family flagellar motor switch protein [Burkholderiaceae bacterium]
MNTATVRTITRLRQEQRAHIRPMVGAAWTDWCAEWRMGPAEAQVEHLVPVPEEAPADMPPWQPLGSHAGEPAWIRGHHQLIAAVIGRPDRSPSAVEQRVRDEAMTSFIECCCKLLGLAPASDAAPHQAAAPRLLQFGDLRIGLTLSGRQHLEPTEIWLPQQAALALLPGGGLPCPSTSLPQPGLVSVDRALAERTLQLRILLSPVRLSLGAITELQVGDVIRLDHPLDTPALAALAAGPGKPMAPLASAHLGQLGKQVAVRLDALIVADQLPAPAL